MQMQIDIRQFKDRPALWVKLYLWILHQAGDPPGEVETTIPEMQKEMSYLIGARPETPSPKRIRKAYEGLSEMGLINHSRGFHSVKIRPTRPERSMLPP